MANYTIEAGFEIQVGEVTGTTFTVESLAGADGQGVPTGGTAGQPLIKQSGTDYDTAFDELDVVGLAQKFKGRSVISAVEIDMDDEAVRTKTITGNTIFTIANPYIGTKVLEIQGAFTVDFADAGIKIIDNGVSYSGGSLNYTELTILKISPIEGTVTYYRAV